MKESCTDSSEGWHRIYRRTPDSTRLLMTASAMKKEGELPQTLPLWAVENPMLNDPSRLAQKVSMLILSGTTGGTTSLCTIHSHAAQLLEGITKELPATNLIRLTSLIFRWKQEHQSY